MNQVGSSQRCYEPSLLHGPNQQEITFNGNGLKIIFATYQLMKFEDKCSV